MSTWREQRAAERAAERAEARADAKAATDRRIAERAAVAKQNRLDAQLRHQLEAQAHTEHAARKAQRTAAVRQWVGDHVVDLLIYPLAVVSAVMAIPSMAAFGRDQYDSGMGALLPVLSELGMWAFAIATQVSRRRSPDRPVWALQLGTLVFAGAGCGLNVAHGLTRGIDAAVVMGFASIAGVAAHQLLTAGRRRSRQERIETSLSRQAARRVERARKAAIRQAVAVIDEHGHAELRYQPGRYQLRLGGRLKSDIHRPSLADEVAAWLVTQPVTGSVTGVTGPDHSPSGGSPVAVLDGPSGNTGNNSGNTGNTGVGEPSTAELVARVRHAIDHGELGGTTQRAIQEFLGVRMSRAGEVQRALKDGH